MKNKLLKTLCLVGVATVQISFAQTPIGECKGKYLGNITRNAVQSTVQSNFTANWNQMTMGNESKWQLTEKVKGTFDFTGSDKGFNWAKNNSGLFKYHALMWGNQTPGWVSKATSAEIQDEIPKYFKAVADHYDPMGGLKLIDVLNEPINTEVAPNLKDALIAGYKAEPANANDKDNQYGWAIWCFQLARKHFPNAVLLINEYGVEMDNKNCRAPYIAMSNAIKNAPNITNGKRNLIDGVGLQAHGVTKLTAANFKACIDEIWNKSGLPIHITEFDVAADPNEAKQLSVYSALIPVAWEHPHVAGITFWGYIQGDTWLGGNGAIGVSGTDTGIMYANGKDRPAMTWLRQYFAGKTSLSCCPAPAPFAACNGSNPPTIEINTPLNNASYASGTTIKLTATATDNDGTIASVKFYDGTTLLNTDNSFQYGFSWTNASVGLHKVKAVATDNSGNTTETFITIKVNVPQAPYNAIVHPIPGTIQLEEYDLGGNGFAYSDNSPGSDVMPVVNYRTTEDVDIETCTDVGGGYNIGHSTAGEWLEYTVNVQSAGNYDIDFRAAAIGDGRTVSLTLGGTAIASNVAIRKTAGGQTWATTSVKNVPLTAGQKVLRLTIGATDNVNLNYMKFTASTISGLESDENSSFSIFPNPFTNDGLQIRKQGSFNYHISDLSGVVLEKGNAQDAQTVGKQLVKGVYFISIEQDNASSTYKIVRQ